MPALIEKLLISLCRLHFTEEQKAVVAGQINGIPDWKHFIWLANEHGITALVYHNLNKLGFLKQLPAAEASALHNSYFKSLSRITNLQEAYNKLKTILEEQNIKLVLIKGMALELTIYGNMGLRQMNDIDLLLDRDKCMEAWRLLISRGYKPNIIKSPLYKTILPYIGKHLPELLKDGISFEIHHSLGNLLIPQLHFLYLVKHLHYHETQGESQLRLYTDLFLLIEKHKTAILNDDLFDLAGRMQIHKALSEKLYILKTFWSLKLPDKTTQYLDSIISGDSLAGFKNFLPKPKGSDNREKSKVYRQNIKSIPGLHRKLIYLLGDLLPSLTYMKQRYKTKTRLAAIIYYPHRLGKLYYLMKN